MYGWQEMDSTNISSVNEHNYNKNCKMSYFLFLRCFKGHLSEDIREILRTQKTVEEISGKDHGN